jgi:hypothetical protein
VRGRRTTEVWKRSCGTAAKAGGKQRKQTSSYSLGRLLPTRKEQKVRRLGIRIKGKGLRLKKIEYNNA